MTYEIVSTSNFTRGLKKLSSTDAQRARKIIEELVFDPYSYKELAGKFKDIRSAKFGDHRIIYSINESTKRIVLLAIERRGSVYNR